MNPKSIGMCINQGEIGGMGMETNPSFLFFFLENAYTNVNLPCRQRLSFSTQMSKERGKEKEKTMTNRSH